MQIQDNKKIFKVIETTKGHILSPYSNDQNSIKLIIFNQILCAKSLQEKINLNLDLQHLNKYIQNPFTLQNTSLPWGTIDHELRQVLKSTNIDPKQILLFDSSFYQQKVPDIFSQYQIVKGYNYRINIDSTGIINEQKKSLMTSEHVLKQIQFEFGLGNGIYKPGYIGEITFEEISNVNFKGIVQAYLKFSEKSGCPIVINFNSRDQQCYFHGFQKSFEQIQNKISEKIKIFKQLLNTYKNPNLYRNIILYNFPMIIQQSTNTFNYNNVFEKQIQSIMNEYGINLGFSLLRYSKKFQKQGLNEIIKLIKKFSNKIIISSGLKFKTDISIYGGQGLSLYCKYIQKCNQDKNFYNMKSIQYLQNILQPNVLNEIMRQNILRLMDWKEKKQQIKIQIFWKCNHCQQDKSQSIKAFAKFGKQFCSINCLKSYKF